MKACPELRSGIDRSSSLSFAIRGIPSPIRPPIRHSREGGNPRTNIPRKIANRDTITYVHTATPLRLPGESTPRTPDTAPESRGEGEGKTTANLCVTTDVRESKIPGRNTPKSVMLHWNM